MDEPVYQFLDKKRTEGKPYTAYMTAAQNKFLRIYYARVRECLATSDKAPFSSELAHAFICLHRLAKSVLSPVCFVVPFLSHVFCGRFFISRLDFLFADSNRNIHNAKA